MEREDNKKKDEAKDIIRDRRPSMETQTKDGTLVMEGWLEVGGNKKEDRVEKR